MKPDLTEMLYRLGAEGIHAEVLEIYSFEFPGIDTQKRGNAVLDQANKRLSGLSNAERRKQVRDLIMKFGSMNIPVSVTESYVMEYQSEDDRKRGHEIASEIIKKYYPK